MLKRKFQSPIHQSSLSREFDIIKSDWSTIYSCKISSLADKKISEFNYKLLNNILCNNYFLAKCNLRDNNRCIHCSEYVENSKHLLFECKIVRKIWEYVEKIFHFHIQWKHIIVGFYHEVNTKTSFLNEFISSVAYSIYKYKMTARYEKKNENEFDLHQYVKNSIVFKHYLCTEQKSCYRNMMKKFIDLL